MPIKPLKNESELFPLIARGDERAFKRLFDGYYQSLGEYVYRLTDSRSIAEELVQDVFIKVWLNRKGLPAIKNFSNYIFILCRNKTYNELKSLASERNFIQQFKIDSETDLHHSYDVNSSTAYRRLFDEAIENLSPQAQKVYLLSRDERLKHDEIAQRLMISSETVKKHIQYANKFIMQYVRKHSDLAIATVLLSTICLV